MSDPAATPDPDAAPDDAGAARLFEEARAPSVASGGRSAPPPPAAIQPHFPELVIESIIGQGGMGVVYRALHRRLDRPVALKVLPAQLGEDPAFTERFAREARTMARLDHPHIVRVYDFGKTDGLYYLVLELVDGANLREVMQAGRLTPQEAIAIVPQLCEALQYAHDQGVVHRDIKPENVLLDRRGRVKVADFGLAKLAGLDATGANLTGSAQVMGTPHYMAPEQYKTPRDVDHRADIFSMGVVFYEMLTGELPVGRFKAPSQAQAIDARIDAIVLRTLERERDLRYQRARDVESDVTRLSSAALPTGPVERGRPARARGRWAVVLSALALPLGFLAVSAAHHAWGGVNRGTEEVFDRELLKAVCGGTVWLAGVALGLVAAVLGARGPGHRWTHKAGVVLVVLNLVLVPAVVVFSMNEARRHAELPRTRDAAAVAPAEALEAGRFRSGIEALWKEVAARLDRGRLGRDDALPFYALADRKRLRTMTETELRERRRRDELGVAFLDPSVFDGDPSEYGVSMALSLGGPQVDVTLVHEGSGTNRRIVFPVVWDERWSSEGGWRLALGPTRVEGGR